MKRFYFVFLLETVPLLNDNIIESIISDFDEMPNVDNVNDVILNNVNLILVWCVISSILSLIVIAFDLMVTMICCGVCCCCLSSMWNNFNNNNNNNNKKKQKIDHSETDRYEFVIDDASDIINIIQFGDL